MVIHTDPRNKQQVLYCIQIAHESDFPEEGLRRQAISVGVVFDFALPEQRHAAESKYHKELKVILCGRALPWRGLVNSVKNIKNMLAEEEGTVDVEPRKAE